MAASLQSLHCWSHGTLSHRHTFIHFFMCACVLGTLTIPGPVPDSAGKTLSWTQPHVPLACTLCSLTSGDQE